MSSSQQGNRRAAQRLDDAAVLKFLTSAAGCYAEASLLTPHDADSLRINLTSLQLEEESYGSVLVQLAKQEDEFLTALCARYGEIGLCRNILRFTINTYLTQTIRCLSELGEGLLTKAQVLFNRPFYIHMGGKFEKRTLFSTVLVNLAEIISDTTEQLNRINEECQRYIPNHLISPKEIDTALDAAIVEQLGFREITAFDVIPQALENKIKRDIVNALTYVLDALSQTVEQLRYNKLNDDTAKLSIICDSLQSQLQMIYGFNFPKNDDLEAWELRRINLMNCLFAINEYIENFKNEFLSKATMTQTLEGAQIENISQDVIRTMATRMITDGTPALKARDAACALIRYMDEQDIEAKTIIPGELAKIDPNLTLSSLELLQTFENDPLMTKTAGEEKKKNLVRREKLLKLFQNRLTQTVVSGAILLLSLNLPACGVKLAPKSKLIEYRPAVDYRGGEIPEHMKMKIIEPGKAKKKDQVDDKK